MSARPKVKKCFYVDEVPEKYHPEFECVGKWKDGARRDCEKKTGHKFNESNCKCKRIKVPSTTPKPTISTTKPVCENREEKEADCVQRRGKFNVETCKCIGNKIFFV